MNVIKGLNLALALALEIAMLAAFGYFGYQAVPDSFVRWLLAVALPLAAAALWATVLAPKATRRLPMMPGILLSLGLFLLAALALALAGHSVLGAVMALAAVVHAALAWAWRQW